MSEYPNTFRAMLHHGVVFFWRVLSSFTDSLGDTVLGYFAPVLCFMLLFGFMQLRVMRSKRATLKDSFNEVWSEIGGLSAKIGIVVYGVLFCVALARETWRDHRELVIAKTTLPRWNENAGAQSGVFGPIMAYEVVEQFKAIPRPCIYKISANADKPNFAATLEWLIQQGAKCERYEDRGPSNADSTTTPVSTRPGIVIHSRINNKRGESVAHFFVAGGYKVSTSNDIPPGSPTDLIWLDVGPGSPLVETAK